MARERRMAVYFIVFIFLMFLIIQISKKEEGINRRKSRILINTPFKKISYGKIRRTPNPFSKITGISIVKYQVVIGYSLSEFLVI